ncbi:hypothetical protein J6590_030909 [Homalodisca vitripennis]|nr:hypothetical protein J6590_030909 [Homalodisca vitripennis]
MKAVRCPARRHRAVQRRSNQKIYFEDLAIHFDSALLCQEKDEAAPQFRSHLLITPDTMALTSSLGHKEGSLVFPVDTSVSNSNRISRVWLRVGRGLRHSPLTFTLFTSIAKLIESSGISCSYVLAPSPSSALSSNWKC